MSSQKQWHRARREYIETIYEAQAEAKHYKARCEWLERRPPWWKPWAVRKWKEEAHHD